jgi:NAD(P)H-flavin reductase
MKIRLKEKYFSENKQVAYLIFDLPEFFSFKPGQFVMLSN